MQPTRKILLGILFFWGGFLQGWAVQRPRTHCANSSIWKKKLISNNIWRSGRCNFVSLGSVEDFITSIIKWPSPPAISDILEWCLLMQHCRAADILTDLHSAGHGRKLPTCFQTTAHNHQVISTNTVPWGIALVQRYGKQSIRERDTNYIHFHFCVV